MAFPPRDHWTGSDPRGRRRARENAHGPAPVPDRQIGGSLPSTSVLPSAAPATGWRRTQLQATARDKRIRRVRIFRGALCASTPNVSCTLQYGTSRWLLIGTAPVQAAASLSASPPHPGVAVGLRTPSISPRGSLRSPFAWRSDSVPLDTRAPNQLVRRRLETAPWNLHVSALKSVLDAVSTIDEQGRSQEFRPSTRAGRDTANGCGVPFQ